MLIMAVLTKQDLRALFLMLAVGFLFDSILGGFLILTGLLGFLIIAGVAWFNEAPELVKLVNDVKSDSHELIVRASLIAVFAGVLLQNAFVIFLGLLIGVVLVVLPIDSINIDLWTLTVQSESQKRQRPAKKGAK